MFKKPISLLIIILAVAIVLSCEDNDNNDENLTKNTIVIESTSYTDWVYFSFEQGDVVSITDPKTSLDWDLAFLRNHMRTNSGTSGSGQGGVYDAGQISFEELNEAVSEGYTIDDSISISDPNDPTRQNMINVAGNTVLEEWGNFDFTSMPPLFIPADHIFVILSATGKYAKIWLKSYYGTDGSSANITMDYIYQSDGSRVFQ
jgi:hypothetical protein